MKKDFLLTSATAKKLYRTAEKLPIYDYHCHLSAKDIYENKMFESVGEMMLGGDHYKWRLMRAYDVPERLITGKAPWQEKFAAYAGVIEKSIGNPLHHWTAMELSRYFGIDDELRAENANDIFNRANRAIAERKLTPRRVILDSGVRFIGTTDDPCDSLEYHKKLAATDFPVRVCPSFRTDRLITVGAADYRDYVTKLGAAAGVDITDLDSFESAICARLDAFTALGCRFSDVGAEHYPRLIGERDEAAELFEKILSGDDLDTTESDLLSGYLFVFLGKEYKKRNLVMQWHLAVKRGANESMTRALGADVGSDCVDNTMSNGAILPLLNAIEADGGLPEVILYALNASMAQRLCSLAGSFRHVRCGAAWWFCDNRRGIEEQLRTVAEQGSIGRFPGMLTDSRSFLSYARHDYYRRILCSLLGSWVEEGECSYEAAAALVEPLCCGNTKALIDGAERSV